MAIIASLAISCSSDEETDTLPSTSSDTQEEFTQTIKFDGRTYSVRCSVRNDSLIYLDEDFNSIYKDQIAPNKNLAVLVYKGENGEDVVEYFPSEKQLTETHDVKVFNDSVMQGRNLRAETALQPSAGRAILYDDTNFKDRSINLDIDYNHYITIPALKAYQNFNDKTSAIRVYNFLNPSKKYRASYWPQDQYEKGSDLRTCLIGYEDKNYKGKVLYCVATYSNAEDLSKPETATHQDWKLKKIGWNDKISSVVFRIIEIKDINDGKINPHDPIN